MLRDRDFVAYRLDSGMEGQISAACAAAGLARRVVAEVVNLQSGAIPATAKQQISMLPIEPPIYRDLCAVVPGRRPPTGPAQALLDAVLDAVAADEDSATSSAAP